MSGPFGQGYNESGARNSDNLLSTKDERIGGEHGYARSGWGRFKDDTKATSRSKVDYRNDIPLTWDKLEEKFPDEFKKADERLAARKDSLSDKMRFKFGGIGYDYDNDQAYKQWQDDAKERQDTLKMHDIDLYLDDQRVQLMYGVRFFSTIGMSHGIYRARQLWKTVDRNYAKLHGVGFGNILLEHVAFSTLKGVGVGVAFGCGTLAGDVLAKLATAYFTDDISIPRRQWQGVTGAFVVGGLSATIATTAMNWNVLKPMGHVMVSGSLFVSSLILGTYLGAYVYKPFQDANPQNYNQTPRPWYEKEFQKIGPTGTRGRWA